MRAMRLARFEGAGSTVPATAPASIADTATPTEGAMEAPESVAPLAPEELEGRLHVTPPPAPAGTTSGFVTLPDGALLRIAALADLSSGQALAAASGTTVDTTVAALGVLRQAIGRAREEHRTATRAIEEERAHREQHATNEGRAMAEALEALAPIRQNRAMQSNPQLAQVVTLLEQGAGGVVTPEVEAALAARSAAAAAARSSRESAARQCVADGELRAAVLCQ